MVKTTFLQRFDKAVKFYDHNYHMHKATFKGLASFYKSYSNIEKDYADAMINLTKTVWDQIPELRTQNTTLLATIKEVINSLQTTSQLHFNYGDRLMQVSSFYQGQYLSSKKKKENHMKIIRDRNSSEYEAFKEKNKSRQALNEKEKQICKVLYENLEKLADEQNERIQKIKQQTIIYFSLFKKICEKQLQRTNEYNIKLVKQEFQVKHPGIQKISQQIRIQHNEYGGNQIERRSYDVNQSMVFNRQSLRNSLIMRQRMTKVNDYQSELKNIVDRFQNGHNQLEVVVQSNSAYGILDGAYFTKQNRMKISRQFSGNIIRAIVFDMLDGYTNSTANDSDTLLLLQLMKTNLKISGQNRGLKSYEKLTSFWGQTKDHPDYSYRWHILFIQHLAKLYTQESSNSDFKQLFAHIKAKKNNDSLQIQMLEVLPIQISICFIDILMDAICLSRDGQQVLIDGFIDFLLVIAKFAEAVLGIERNFTVLILMKKVERLIANKPTSEQLQLILNQQYFTNIPASKKKEQDERRENYKQSWIYELVNNCNKKILIFYEIKPSLLNYVKILLIIEKLGLIYRQRFSATERVYMGIKYAGYNFLKNCETSLKILDPEGWSGEERLRNIVEVTEDLDYQGILNQFINPAAMELGRLLGVGENKLQNKMFDEFTEAFYKIMQANLEIISEQEGTDRQGYALRLGIILARLDLMNPLPINEYDPYFKVLKTYLQSTQKQYDKLLQHSRQTQLWIMQQNYLATPNCIDFCSMLYKPFEFLLISLKKLQESNQTDYTKKYSEFIKLKLNTDLRDQIIKYINFLYESLTLYQSEPPQLALKPRRLQKMHKINKQETEKDRYNFKQLTRRLFNLLFLKQQLEEMIEDFLDPQLYKKLNNSIYNLDKLKKYSSQSAEYRDILKNIQDIVSVVLSNEDKIVKKVANITVFHFFKKIFDNLYFQDEKNAIQEFFSNNSDYKLSQYTFVHFQEQLEEWFAVIAKNIPDQFIDQFSQEFSKAFYEAIKFQALNSTKFKIPISAAKTVPYLDSDITFMTTLMKQKFFDENVIQNEIQKPFQKILDDLRSDTSKLAGIFESATLKNDKQKCKYVLVLLNLRPKDEKAVQFIKKYKTIVK